MLLDTRAHTQNTFRFTFKATTCGLEFMVCKSYLCAALRGSRVRAKQKRHKNQQQRQPVGLCVLHSWTISLSIIVIIHYIIIGGSHSYTVLGNIARGCYCWHEIIKTNVFSFVHTSNQSIFLSSLLREYSHYVCFMEPNYCISFKAFESKIYFEPNSPVALKRLLPRV